MPQEPLTSNRRLGIVGLGLLGTALAERVLQHGFTVLGFDTDPQRGEALQRAGGEAAANARVVLERCRRVMMVLPDDGVTRAVLASLDDRLTPQHLIVDCTTGDADAAAQLGTSLAARGVGYVDATVSGSSEQARRGEALFMVGGSAADFARSRDLFDALGGRAIHVGPCGAGAKMKLVTNLVLGLNRAALAEGLVLASTFGLDPESTLDVLKASAAYSKAMDAKGAKMIAGDFAPQARLSQHLKDVRLMLAAAARVDRTLPLSETHRKLLELAESLGCGDLDNSAVLRAVEAWRPNDG